MRGKNTEGHQKQSANRRYPLGRNQGTVISTNLVIAAVGKCSMMKTAVTDLFVITVVEMSICWRQQMSLLGFVKEHMRWLLLRRCLLKL